MRSVSSKDKAAAYVAAFLLLTSPSALAQVVPDMVSRTALRVCSDPSNLPFSNRKQQGFENKIAQIVADQLKEPVRYLWAPSGPGFVRNTLNSDLCDIVMGYAVGSEMVQSTNPYYRSTYVIVTSKGSDLAKVASMDDRLLKGRRIGVFAATPPVDVMLAQGLIDQAKVYPLLVDHRFDSPLNVMLTDLESKAIDAAIVWGPLIGDAVKMSDGKLDMAPLLKDVDRPGFSYRISFGVRHDEPDWKHKLEAVIRARAIDINKVLVDYNVPLIDNDGHLISPAVAMEDASKLEQAAAPGGKRASPKNFRMPGPAATPQDFKMPGPAPSNGAPGGPKP